MSGFSLAALKNTLDEVRVSVYAKNETEKKVCNLHHQHIINESNLLNLIALSGVRSAFLQELGCIIHTDERNRPRNMRIVRIISQSNDNNLKLIGKKMFFTVTSIRSSMILSGLLWRRKARAGSRSSRY